MSDIAIKVENLSKRYRIGTMEETHDTFREMIMSWVKSPVSNFKRLQSLSKFDENGEADDIIWALRDVSFEVKHGEVLGIIGRNGAGKSTLLKILCRITEPTSGQAIVNGRVASLLEVGTGFHPELTGRENVYLNGTILGMSKTEIDRKFDEIVDFSGVEKFIDTPVKRYSSGMRVRLAFAVAAHLEPEILLIDEVLAVGDVAFRKKCLGKMQEVSQRGRTVVLVSHQMPNIRRICEKAIWLEDGSIFQSGSAMDVTLAYETETVYKKTSSNGVSIRDGHHNPDVWINKAEIKDINGNSTTDFRYGDDIILNVHLSYGPGYESRGYRDLALQWIMTDESDIRISADEMVSYSLGFDNNIGVIQVKILSIPLYKGTYRLELDVTHESMGRIDTWENAVNINVIHCNPVGKGLERDRRSGFLHIGTEWRI